MHNETGWLILGGLLFFTLSHLASVKWKLICQLPSVNTGDLVRWSDMRVKMTHALPDVCDLRTSRNCYHKASVSPTTWPKDGWMQPTYMHSVSFSGQPTSSSRISASRSDYPCYENSSQKPSMWGMLGQQPRTLIPLTTTHVVVFYQREVNNEVTDQTRKLAIERRWVVTEIPTATVNAITLWVSITFGFPYLRVCWIAVLYSSSQARVLMARIPETTWFINEMRLSDTAAVRKRSAALT